MFELEMSYFLHDQDSEVLVRERAYRTKLESANKRKRGRITKETLLTVTMQKIGKSNTTMYTESSGTHTKDYGQTNQPKRNYTAVIKATKPKNCTESTKTNKKEKMLQTKN